MTKNDVFPSQWKKATDLNREGEELTIKEVTMEKIGENSETKAAVWFEECNEGLICNVTNWNTIVELTGEEDSDNWPGKRMRLVRARVPFGGKIVDAIRIEAATPKPKPTLKRRRSDDSIN
jgi:hypothetical protein